MFTSMEKQETVQCLNEVTPHVIDEEGIPCNGYMYSYKSLQSPEYVNDFGSKDLVLDEVKNQFPEDECSQPVLSISSRLVFENKDSSNVMGTQDIEQENKKEELLSINKQEVEDENTMFIIVTEGLEEHNILDDVGDTSKDYNNLTTPQAIQMKSYGTISQNSYNLLQQNNEYIEAVPPRQVDNEMNELHYCQCCNKYFSSFADMLVHVRDAHSNMILFPHDNEQVKDVPPKQVDNKMNELHKCQCCDEHFDSYDMMLAHRDTHSNMKPKFDLCQKSIKPYSTERNSEEITYKCESCERVYKRQGTLQRHMERMHGDYGKIFPCWCGEQFRSSTHLNLHNIKHHRTSEKNERVSGLQCDYCLKVFKGKAHLAKHIRCLHYDYGKKFECWCGQQFSTPNYLSTHKSSHIKPRKRKGNKSTLRNKFAYEN